MSTKDESVNYRPAKFMNFLDVAYADNTIFLADENGDYFVSFNTYVSDKPAAGASFEIIRTGGGLGEFDIYDGTPSIVAFENPMYKIPGLYSDFIESEENNYDDEGDFYDSGIPMLPIFAPKGFPGDYERLVHDYYRSQLEGFLEDRGSMSELEKYLRGEADSKKTFVASKNFPKTRNIRGMLENMHKAKTFDKDLFKKIVVRAKYLGEPLTLEEVQKYLND